MEREGPDCETARFFAAVKKELEAMRPDLIVMYDTDHLNTAGSEVFTRLLVKTWTEEVKRRQ